MIDFDAVKEFIGFVTHEDNDMPYGGLVDDAPKQAKEAYAKYLKTKRSAEESGVLL